MSFKEADAYIAELQETAERLYYQVKETVLTPFRIATSKLALQAYITSILFFFTGVTLFGFAIASYILFYWSYIPQLGFSRGIHLQYDPIPLECRTYLTQLNLLNPSTTPISSLLIDSKGPQDKGELSTLLAAKCGGTPSPWGTAAVNPEVITQQGYDVVLELVMPRTPLNTATGNFMIDARLLSSPISPATSPHDQVPHYNNPFDPAVVSSSAETNSKARPADVVVAHTRLPTSLPYVSPLLTLTEMLFSVPKWFFGLPVDTITLRVPLFSRVIFPRPDRRSRTTPSQLHLQLVNPRGQQLQVYSVEVQFRARFTGLRWLMYNWRLSTASFFIIAFFAAECLTTLVVYAVLQFIVFGPTEEEVGGGKGKSKKIKSGGSDIKKEDGETDGTEGTDRFLSDAERIFPSYGSQPPLRYPGSDAASGRDIKREDGSGEPGSAVLATMTPGAGGEADDEDDEDADYVLDDPSGGRWRDSGIGTSMDSSREGGVRRRRSKGSSAGRSGGGRDGRF